MRRASVIPTSAHNLYILMPYYYSEPTETYKDAEEKQEILMFESLSLEIV